MLHLSHFGRRGVLQQHDCNGHEPVYHPILCRLLLLVFLLLLPLHRARKRSSKGRKRTPIPRCWPSMGAATITRTPSENSPRTATSWSRTKLPSATVFAVTLGRWVVSCCLWLLLLMMMKMMTIVILQLLLFFTCNPRFSPGMSMRRAER